jgi:putative ABC transport system ATP-binding protein
MPNSLSITDLKFSWSKNTEFNLIIPKWQVNAGQKVFLYGRSGEGKSTLLNLISGIENNYTGSVEVLGQNLAALSQMQRDTFRANNIGIIFQQFNLLPYLSALNNILLAQSFKKNASNSYTNQLASICDKLELSQQLLSQKASELSVGQQQRVAVARALLGSPSMIIADEPTSALDSETRENFIQLLLETAKSATVIFVSHDLSLSDYFDTQVRLADLQTSQLTNNVGQTNVV